MKQKKQRYLMIRSRHPTHDALRKCIECPKPAVLRLGSTTEMNNVIEINTINAVKTSANKLLMKRTFTEAGVRTADWWELKDIDMDTLPYPVVLKHIYGSRGTGNTLIRDKKELEDHISHIDKPARYIVEKFYSYLLEFRLHVTKDGCFYTCRKAMKADTPPEERWRFHSDTSSWYLENNEKFYKPNSWDDIVSDCVKALKAIGADILAFDVKVQSPTDKDGNPREYQHYILLESNSAPSLGELGAEKYKEILPKIIQSFLYG